MKYLKAKGDLEKLKEGTVDSKYQCKINYILHLEVETYL